MIQDFIIFGHVYLSKNADIELQCDTSPLTSAILRLADVSTPPPAHSSTYTQFSPVSRAVAGEGAQKPAVVHQADIQN